MLFSIKEVNETSSLKFLLIKCESIGKVFQEIYLVFILVLIKNQLASQILNLINLGDSAKLCSPHAHVPRALCVLVSHVPLLLRAFIPLVPRDLFTAVPTVCSVSYVLSILTSLVPCTFLSPFPLFFRSHRISCLACLEPYISSKFMNPFYLRTLSASYLQYSMC